MQTIHWLDAVRQAAQQAAARENTLATAFNYRWEHVQAVVATALHLADLLGADREIVAAAAWLHDVAKQQPDKSASDHHGLAGALCARRILGNTDFPHKKIDAVADAIAKHVGLVCEHQVQPLEAAILWDADKLTKLGALATTHATVLGLQEGTVAATQDVAAWVFELDLARRMASSMNTLPAQRAALARLQTSANWVRALNHELESDDLAYPSANSSGYASAGLRQDGRDGWLWSPVWRIKVELAPCERALLQSWPLRRLHFVRHNGASALAYPVTTSRLQHTLGVFALAAHFVPDDEMLRVAALLHDVGHYAFCHSVERLPNIDHHAMTRQRLTQDPIKHILMAHDLQPEQVLALIDGSPPNPLRTHNGWLHLDHLDSFAREAESAGFGEMPPYDLLPRLHLEGVNVAADLATAEYLVRLIRHGNQRYYVPGDVGLAALLMHVLELALARGLLSQNDLAEGTDEALLAQLDLAGDEEIKRLVNVLRFEPWSIHARRLEAGESPPAGALVSKLCGLYDAVPLVLGTGQPVTTVSVDARAEISQIEALPGVFAVWLDDTV